MLVSYLHITWGKHENFEYDVHARRIKTVRRLIEGRFKIPESPLQIGFDVGELFARLQRF